MKQGTSYGAFTVDAFFAYLRLHDHEVPASGKLRDGFTYALNQERYLKIFLTDGEVPIDNNASERCLLRCGETAVPAVRKPAVRNRETANSVTLRVYSLKD